MECIGFSVVAAIGIIGVSLLILFEALSGSFIPTVENVRDAYDDLRDRAVDQVRTDTTIINASTPANGSNYDLNFTVNNSGNVNLETGYFDVLINGTSHEFTCSSSYLYVDGSVYFIVSNLPGTGIRRLKVVTNNGISDYFEYTIT